MKIQDVAFFVVLALVIFRGNPKLATFCGMLCLFLSIPLFSFWIFFTAERLVWYAGVFFLLALILNIYSRSKYENRN